MKTFEFQYQNRKGWNRLPLTEELDSSQTLILVFCSPAYRETPEVFKELAGRFPNSLIVGCSTSGEILNDQIFDMSISCVGMRFEQAQIRSVTEPLAESKDSFEAGKRLAEGLERSDLKGVIVLSDGLSANGSALIEGLNSKIDSRRVIISGGLAGDGNHFKHTWLIHNGEIRSQVALAVGLYGDSLTISGASRGGWDIFGPERLITRSESNIVYEIDNRPALDLYKEYLGERSKDLPASGLLFPIQIRKDAKQPLRLVRTILGVDEHTKALIFAGSVPQGHLAQLMRANFNRLIDGASEAAEVASEHVNLALGHQDLESPSVCLAVSCVGRRLVLGERAVEEIEALQSAVKGVKSVVGFYSYGELAPASPKESCDFHNQSMSMMQIIEKPKRKITRVG